MAPLFWLYEKINRFFSNFMVEGKLSGGVNNSSLKGL